jgi:PTS system fructose-specific IIC component
MKITDLLEEKAIKLNSLAASKEEVLNQMINLISQTGNIVNKQEFKETVFRREKEGTTGIGEGIAIPHGKSRTVKKATLAAMVLPKGVEFEALDGKKVNIIILIAAPENQENTHLEVLSRLSALLMDEKFRENLKRAKTPTEFINFINEAENAKYGEEKAVDELLADTFKASMQENTQKGTYEILCITSCPTGIAHTYMAAEALEKAGKETNHTIKVETQGQSGVKNHLTKEEIQNAKAIIIAADTNVDLTRFNGKKLLKTRVADGIHKPKELIERALSDEIPIYDSGENSDSQKVNSDEKEGIGRSIYRHLMNGVTHMLPFVVGGGILIAISFLLDNYEINPAGFGSNTPVAAFFNTIGNAAFGFMLTILSGYIAMSIADRPGLAAGFVGGAVAVSGVSLQSISNPDVVTVSSGFLGALLAGFIAGYIILILKRLFSLIPKSLEGIRTILLYPVFGILLTGAAVMLINPAVGMINTGLNNFLNGLSGTNKVILGAILGGMMSVDLGGPVNKAAYTFGTGMLSQGHYDIMAAVMAGGMVAPLVIALLATFFPKKLAQKDRSSALLNYILGFSFISEGAIPFASSDPLRVLPSCIIGSAVSGALSMLFNCTVMAPHGGIFVIGIVGNALMYIVSIGVGAIVGALILAALKKSAGQAKAK